MRQRLLFRQLRKQQQQDKVKQRAGTGLPRDNLKDYLLVMDEEPRDVPENQSFGTYILAQKVGLV